MPSKRKVPFIVCEIRFSGRAVFFFSGISLVNLTILHILVFHLRISCVCIMCIRYKSVVFQLYHAQTKYIRMLSHFIICIWLVLIDIDIRFSMRGMLMKKKGRINDDDGEDRHCHCHQHHARDDKLGNFIWIVFDRSGNFRFSYQMVVRVFFYEWMHVYVGYSEQSHSNTLIQVYQIDSIIAWIFNSAQN